MASEQDGSYRWVIEASEAGVRIDRFLAERKVLGTRSQIHRLIADGCVRIGERAVKAGTALRTGDVVEATRPVAPPQWAAPAAIALDVLYEDEQLLAINKPPGMVVHPAPGHWQGTLVSALLHRWPELPAGFDRNRLGIVHRLDKDTSGVLLIARTGAALADLGDQFRDREVGKQYLALVWGLPRTRTGTVDRPIGRHPVQRKKMAVQARGRAARTRWEVVERFGRIALVRAYPETGRTHQIRVHLAAIGHPIVGDALYSRGLSGGADLIGRQALHAESIAFRHPTTGRRLRIEAPVAADMVEALAALRAQA